MNDHLKRNCECCHAQYATGKEYGQYWLEPPSPDFETMGLCEFCNQNSKWYTPDKSCHKSK